VRPCLYRSAARKALLAVQGYSLGMQVVACPIQGTSMGFAQRGCGHRDRLHESRRTHHSKDFLTCFPHIDLRNEISEPIGREPLHCAPQAAYEAISPTAGPPHAMLLLHALQIDRVLLRCFENTRVEESHLKKMVSLNFRVKSELVVDSWCWSGYQPPIG
jgi:hypothetical protein